MNGLPFHNDRKGWLERIVWWVILAVCGYVTHGCATAPEYIVCAGKGQVHVTAGLGYGLTVDCTPALCLYAGRIAPQSPVCEGTPPQNPPQPGK